MDYLITDILKYINRTVFGTAEYQTICVLMGLVIALTLVLPGRRMGQRLLIGGLILYCFLVFSSTVMIRVESIDDPFKYISPFTEYKSMISHGGFKYDIVENVLLFVPSGILLASLDAWKCWWLPIVWLSCFSLCIEVMQGLLKVGYTEFDDWFNNSIGAAAGVVIVLLLRKIKRNRALN